MVAAGRSGVRGVFFFNIGEIAVCLFVDGTDLIFREN